MAKPFTQLSGHTVVQGRVFSVEEEEWRGPDGNIFKRQTVKHPGAVAMVPVDTRGRVLLIRQFRPALNAQLVEIPAGTLEKGEAPLACAKRELIEELGFAAKKWKKLGAVALAPGYSSEIIHIYKAWDLTPARGEQDEDEHIAKPVAYSRAQLKKAIASGRIRDAKTLSGLFLCGMAM